MRKKISSRAGAGAKKKNVHNKTMCLSFLPDVNPERTIVTFLPDVRSKKMVLTYTIVSSTDDKGRFLMAVPIRVTEGTDIYITDVGAVHNTTNVKNALDPFWQHGTRLQHEQSWRSLSSQESVMSVDSGPFQIYLVKNTNDIEQVERVILDCGVDARTTQMYIEQMKNLDCQFLFVKYLPACMELKTYIMQELQEQGGVLDEHSVLELAMSIYEDADATTLAQKAVLGLFSKTPEKYRAFQDKVLECRTLYGNKHMMSKGVYLRMAMPVDAYDCLFVLHEKSYDAVVDQKYQIVVPYDMELYAPGDVVLPETTTLFGEQLALQSMYALMDDRFPRKRTYLGCDGFPPTLYTYTGLRANLPLTLRPRRDLDTFVENLLVSAGLFPEDPKPLPVKRHREDDDDGPSYRTLPVLRF